MRLHNTTDNWNNMLARRVLSTWMARDSESQPPNDDRFFRCSNTGKSLLKLLSMKAWVGLKSLAFQPQLRLGVSCMLAVNQFSWSLKKTKPFLISIIVLPNPNLEPPPWFNSWLEPLNINFGFEICWKTFTQNSLILLVFTSTAVSMPTKYGSLFDWDQKNKSTSLIQGQ